ncbi:unnamed protein product [Leptidea sinapis]|uniref:Diacylglycerol kinase n=1 Tax=Leptidea sinapis TaxID=189913 RepID=A0A5E4QZT4_9NEOP|nr:unnamed protein product [Leptidea sinapis]
MPHQWLEGNLPVAAKCDICDKTCGSVLRLQDFRCIWCRRCVHANCRPSWRSACSLGPSRASIVPPTKLHSVGPDDGWLPDRPPNASPLIVFVNSRSGDNQGVKFLRRFKQLLNPAQVFELSGAGPRLGLRLFRHFAPLRVLVCSGDGSVGWVLQERQVQTAVLPLGTGNDLARVLGWGSSCDDAANLQQLLERYERASTKMLDREARVALREGCARLVGVGERAGGGAARAAHRLKRALSLLLHARTHVAHDHAKCDIPDVDEDIVKLISTNSTEPAYNLGVEKSDQRKSTSASPQDRLSLSNLSSCDTSSCRNLFRPDVEPTSGTYNSCSLTIPNLVVSDDSNKRDSSVQGETYESDQLTIIDIDKPYTDEVHFEMSQRAASASGEFTPERKLSSVDLEIDATSSEGSNISDDFSLVSEIIDSKPDDIDDGCIGHIDSPEVSETTYMNSETIHGESIMDDISSMLGQDVLLAMMGKNGENETYTDDTTLFTSDTVSDIPMDSRNPSIEKTNEAKFKYISKSKKPVDTDVEKFGFENRVFYLENAAKADEQVKYCSLAQFEEGSDIARKSFRKHLRKSLKKRVVDDTTVKHLLPRSTTEEFFKGEDTPLSPSTELSPNTVINENMIGNKEQTLVFPQINVVVEPPSPSHSDEKKSIRSTSRMASVLSDIFDHGTDTLSVHSPEPSIISARERRQSDNPKLLGCDSEYGQFLSCSPAASRRISCGSLFKPGEPDNRLTSSVSSIWGEGGMFGSTTKSESSDKIKKLPIINPLVQLPAWPHVTQGFISQCLLANADALCAAVSPLMDPDETLLEGFYERAVMNNYFGIGIDAKITLDFHNKREEHPEKCRSRARNYMWHLGQRVQLECDGQRIPLPELQGIVVLNISSFMGGTNFWGGTRGDDIFLAPSFDDRILEVVAVFGSAQMAASRLINLQKHRIAQCRAVQINILGDEGVPVQVDGEAWLQPPGCVRIIHKNRAQMLCRSRALETSLRTWDEKQQQKAQAGNIGRSLPSAEATNLLSLLDDINTVKLSCISESGSGRVSNALSIARRVAAQADALQDADGRLLPPPHLRRLLATLAPKKGNRWLRSRRSVSESGTASAQAQVKSWGIKEVQTWLESIELGEYAEAFAKHDVTGRELLSLARRDLRDLGVTKVGHVKRILQAVKDLQ